MIGEAFDMKNLNKILEYYVHRPITTAGDVLYRRIDNSIDEADRSVKDEKIYNEEVQKKYNSPDNIRRLVFTEKRIIVQYFKNVIGAETLGTIRNTAISEFEDIDMNTRRNLFIASKLKGYSGMLNMARSKGIEVEQISGSGLKALVRPWVTQNIEEIYFDWLALTGVYSGNNTLEAYGSSTSIADRNEVIKSLVFEALEVDDMQSLRERFPRLRIVGCILNLEEFQSEILDVMKETKDTINSKCILEAIKGENVKVWGAFASYGVNVSIKYSCKDGLYSFDKEVLKEYFEQQVKAVIDSRDEKTEDVQIIKNADSEVIRTLERVKEVYGTETLKKLIKAEYAKGYKGLNNEEARYIKGIMG